MKKVFLLSVLGASLLLASCFASSEDIDSKITAFEKACNSSYSSEDASYEASKLLFSLLTKRSSMTQRQKDRFEKVMSNCKELKEKE